MNHQTAWFAVATRPAAEYVAEIEMRRVGMTTYLPQFRKEYRHHRSKAWITQSFPLFAGYLFTPTDAFDWDSLKSCNGVEADPVLRDPASRKLLPLSDAIIKRIRENEEMGAFDELRSSPLRMHAGDTVKIADGALAGFEGPLSRVKSRHNVELLARLFNTEIKVTTSITRLARVA